jgi:hypothetical protein
MGVETSPINLSPSAVTKVMGRRLAGSTVLGRISSLTKGVYPYPMNQEIISYAPATGEEVGRYPNTSAATINELVGRAQAAS